MNTPTMTTIETFVEAYLRALPRQPKKDGRLFIRHPGFRPYSLVHALLGGKPQELPAITVTDPTLHLNRLLFAVMRTGNPDLVIPSEIVLGFSGCARHCFYGEFNNSFKKGKLLSVSIEYPPYLVVPMLVGNLYWTRPPENGTEQLYHFLFHLRELMKHLADHPIGKKTSVSTSDVAQMLSVLPRRAVFIRSGDEMGVIYTDDTLPSVSGAALAERLRFIQAQTRAVYCRSKADVEQELIQQKPAPTTRSEVL